MKKNLKKNMIVHEYIFKENKTNFLLHRDESLYKGPLFDINISVHMAQ